MPLADHFRQTVRAMLRAMSRKGVMRETDRKTLLQVIQEYTDQLFPLVERLILREADRLGQGQALRKLMAGDSQEALVFLKTLFPNYRMILVEVVNEAIRKVIADRRKADNEKESAGGGKKV
jgi:hypothetical protein